MKHIIQRESDSILDILMDICLITALTIFLLVILDIKDIINVQIFNSDFIYGLLYSFIIIISFFLFNANNLYQKIIRIDKEISNQISIFMPLKLSMFLSMFLSILLRIKEYHDNFLNGHSITETDVNLYLYMFIFLYTSFTLFFSAKILIRLIGIYHRTKLLNNIT